MIPHLPGWLVALAIAIPIGPLVFTITPHVTGGTLAGIGVSLKLTALPAIAAILLVFAILYYSVSSGPAPKAAKPSRPHAAASATAGEVGVVEAFFTAINGRNWQRVWQLGGKNLGTDEYRTIHGMIKGYQCTDRDVLNDNPTARGEVVSGSYLAYEANGTAHAVQRYVFRYVLRDGVIVSGHQSSSGSPPPGCGQ